MNLLVERELSIGSKIALENLAKALAIREMLEPLGLNPEIRLRKNGGQAVLQLTLRRKNVSEVIRDVVKILSAKFDKKESSCGFLLYETNIEGIVVKINTSDCFYGGKPEVIIQQPRTKAYCKRQTEVPRFVSTRS